jgi:hypothetical protein
MNAIFVGANRRPGAFPTSQQRFNGEIEVDKKLHQELFPIITVTFRHNSKT